jgi:hypothetical protein
MPYSDQLFSPTHAANQPTTSPPTRYCCMDAYSNKNFILCASCPHQPRKRMPDDDYDVTLVPVNQQPQPEINHELSPNFEGPLWE